MNLEMITIKGNILVGIKGTILNISNIEHIYFDKKHSKMIYSTNNSEYSLECTEDEYLAFYGMVFCTKE